MPYDIEVKLLAITPDAESLCEQAGRLCYASGDKQGTSEEWLQKRVKQGHESLIEHSSATFYIKLSRCCANELVRHRIASYCLSGDTIVGYDHRIKGRTIKELYELNNTYKSVLKLRSINEQSHEIIFNKISRIFSSGVKELYKVTTKDGYYIKATKEHQFFTKDGWKQLCELKVGDYVYTNGIDAYKSPEWLRQKYNIENMHQFDIGKICGVSKETIRKWVRIFGLQKPIGSWTIGVEPPNKNKTKEIYEPLMRISLKLIGRKNPKLSEYRGISHHSYKGDDITKSAGYGRILRNYKKKNVCELCGKTNVHTEVHHLDKNPVHSSDDNLVELCVPCHKLIHKGVGAKAVKPSLIVKIEYVGEEETYDISMKEPYNNFVANGFVVHNSQRSQRYVKESKPNYILPDEVKGNIQAETVFKNCMEYAWKGYQSLLEKGYKPEIARYVLPNACMTEIICTWNFREIRHIIQLRTSKAALPEMQEVAGKIRDIMKEHAPKIFGDL